MAKLAAIQENCEENFKQFNDIISFDEKEDVFYIPSLLQGSPPMAPVNPEYGRAVQRIKENIITLMCSKESFQHSVSQFRERVCNLWTAMLKENFIFSFRNTIEVRARMSLDRKYFEESVILMVTGMAELQVKIEVALKRCSTRDERREKWAESERKIRDEAEELGKKMGKALKVFFETNEDKATLEQWRENVMTKIKEQKEIQVLEITKNCLSTFYYLQKRQDVEGKKLTYEEKLLERAKKFITSAHDTEDAEKRKMAFEQEWRQWIADVPQCQERKTDVNNEMVNVLCDTDPALSVEIREKLTEQNYIISNFKKSDIVIAVDDLTYNVSYIQKFLGYAARQAQCLPYARKIKKTAVSEALDFAKNTSELGVRFTRNDLTQMYHKAITTINKGTEKSFFKFLNSLKCDILLYTFAQAYEIFYEMEERYVQERDIRGELERNLRPELETYFENVCQKMGKEKLAATSFVDVLQKQIESTLNWTMGPVVTREMLKNRNCEFQSKGRFHASVLIQLGEEGKFESYIPYLENPLGYLRTKLMEAIESYCLEKNPASITLLLEDEVKKIENDVFAAISTANKETKTGSKKLTVWIQRFVEECSTLAIKKETFSVAAIEDLEDIEVFQDKVLEFLNKRGVDLATFRKWNPSPLDCLSNCMFFCLCSCPFCEALCDQTLPNHNVHSTLSHRPRGIIGYKHDATRKLSTNICTKSIADRKDFKNLDTCWEWHPYKEYQSVNNYYKSWSICEDPSFEPSKYWQWFMATFSKKLAEYHEAEEAEIPKRWKRCTFSEASDQLRRQFNLPPPNNVLALTF